MTHPDDEKLVALARAARARTGAAVGAAVRDLDGRSYASSQVDLPSLRLSAVDLAVAMAISSGATGLEAIATVGDPGRLVRADAARDFAGPDVPIHVADVDGSIVAVKRT